jgi:hypothetical protein
MKSSIWKRIFRSSAILALSGMASIAAAAPQNFPVTATVQNAITLSSTTPMTFGTVFITKTASSASPAAGESSKLNLSTASVTTQGAAASPAAPPLLSLVGGTAGTFTAPGLPTGGVVKVTVYNNETTPIVITNAVNSAAAACLQTTSALALAAGKIVMTHSAGDPNTGFFCVDAFVSDKTGLIQTGAQSASTGYTMLFADAGTLTFNLGATLVQQVMTSGQKNYEAGVYTGTIGLEATFP